jgi:hypothetical protein
MIRLLKRSWGVLSIRPARTTSLNLLLDFSRAISFKNNNEYQYFVCHLFCVHGGLVGVLCSSAMLPSSYSI